MTRRHAWLGFAAAAGVLYFLLPPGGAWQAIVFLVLLAGSIALVGVRVARGTFPPVARLLFAGQLVYFAATAAWLGVPLVTKRAQPFPSLVDGLFFAAYALFGLFLVRLLAIKSDPDRGHVIDALVVTLGISAVAWHYVGEPALTTPGVSGTGRAVALAYPVAQMTLLALAVRLDLLASVRNAAEVALALWIAGELAADALYGLLSAEGRFSFGHPLSVGWLLSYAAMGLFALDPLAPRVLEPRADDTRPSAARRLVVLGLASLAPLVLLVTTERLGRDELAVIALAAGASFVLVLYRVSRLTVDVLEQRRLSGQLADLAQELRERAFRDPLTGLGNRALLTERLTEALARRGARSSDVVAVLAVDLDGFKQVNDSMGHDAGDTLLREVAARLASAVRPEDLVARPGGDEFAVLVTGVGATGAMRVAARVVETLARPMSLGTRVVRPAASVGMALAEDDADAERLLRQADIAMYAAKSSGGSRWEVYAVERHQAVLDRQRLEIELRDVAERGELVLHYQPIFDLADRRVLGCEALMRWQHPERGLVYPGGFIDVAEDSALILPMGLWAIQEACRQAAAWASALPRRIGVSVNVSRRQLRDADLAGAVADALRRSGVRPDLITLEVTETALIEDVDVMCSTLEDLKALGVGLSMDDFGTGYSSLSDLRRLPVDVIKVDRAFVDGIAREHAEWSLTVAIVRLAASLGKRTLAEGIETAAQLAHLRALGCEMGQGFLLGRPMPADEFERFVLSSDVAADRR